jgi:hypothetical protein
MRISRLQLTLYISAFLSITGPSFAQQKIQSCDVPLMVGYWWKLHSNDLTVHLGTELVAVDNVFLDNGPKRVAVILDSSKQTSDEQWKVLLDIATTLVEHSRPQDTFSLFLVGADDSDGPFLTTEDVRNRLRKFALSSPPHTSPDTSERIYDAILAAATHLTPSKFGDVIVFLGHDKDSGSIVSWAQAQELILRNRAAFYGVSFYNSKIRMIPTPISKQLNKHLQTTLIEAAKMVPRYSPTMTLLYDREKQKGNANHATLAVARKLVAYLKAVDRGQTHFLVIDQGTCTAA